MISGASGLVGSALIASLRADGADVRQLVRRPARDASEISWDPATGRLDPRSLDGADAVVNLSGERIDQRWTNAARRAIRESRIQATSTVAHAITSLDRKPRMLLNASAIGLYGNHGEDAITESTPPGSDFLASVVHEWEAAAEPVAQAGVRVVKARSGVIVSDRGGAIARMLPPFKLGVGGRAGPGSQWTSWISLTDEVRAMRFLLEREDVAGGVNLVAPTPVRNEEFAKTLGQVLHRPAITPVPAFVLDLMFGEMARDTLLASARVLPEVLLKKGFVFQHPTLEQAMRAEIRV